MARAKIEEKSEPERSISILLIGNPILQVKCSFDGLFSNAEIKGIQKELMMQNYKFKHKIASANLVERSEEDGRV